MSVCGVTPTTAFRVDAFVHSKIQGLHGHAMHAPRPDAIAPTSKAVGAAFAASLSTWELPESQKHEAPKNLGSNPVLQSCKFPATWHPVMGQDSRTCKQYEVIIGAGSIQVGQVWSDRTGMS